MSTASQAPSQTPRSQAAGSQWATSNAAASKLRWAALDSRNERLATAADSVRADPSDNGRELKAS